MDFFFSVLKFASKWSVFDIKQIRRGLLHFLMIHVTLSTIQLDPAGLPPMTFSIPLLERGQARKLTAWLINTWSLEHIKRDTRV